MSRLRGAALDRAVANAMGLKSVHNCEKWGEEHRTDDKPSSVFDWRRPAKESIVEAISKTAQRSASATKFVEKKRREDPDYGKISNLSKPHQGGLLEPRQFTVYGKVRPTEGKTK